MYIIIGLPSGYIQAYKIVNNSNGFWEIAVSHYIKQIETNKHTYVYICII